MVLRLFRQRETSSPRSAARAPEGTRLYAVGDIHGRRDLLDKLHALIAEDWSAHPAARGVVIYLGDYIDRGPDSRGVIEALLNLQANGLEYHFLKGNHEEMLQSFLADPTSATAWPHLGGTETMLSYGVEVRFGRENSPADQLSSHFAGQLPPAHHQFITDLQHSVTFGDYFFCHAGVRPGIPLDKQSPTDLLWIRAEFLNSRADHGAIVVHGHSPAEHVEVHPNRICVDTGAYATGKLSCVVLHGDEHHILST